MMRKGLEYHHIVPIIVKGRYAIAVPFRGMEPKDIPPLAGRYNGRQSIGHRAVSGCYVATYVNDRRSQHARQIRSVVIHTPSPGCPEKQLVYGREVLRSSLVIGGDTCKYAYDETIELGHEEIGADIDFRWALTRSTSWLRDGVPVPGGSEVETKSETYQPTKLTLPDMVVDRVAQMVEDGARSWVAVGRPLEGSAAYIALASQLMA